MQEPFSRALWLSIEEAVSLLFRDGSPRRWMSWAVPAWLSVLGAAVLELPVDALSGGHLAGWLRQKIPALSGMWMPGACLLAGVAILLAWLRANGLMVFLDCMVRPEDGLAAAWRRQRSNAACLFVAWVTLGSCAVILGGGLVGTWLWWFRRRALSWDCLGAEDALAFGSVCAIGAVGAVVLGAIGCLAEDIACAFLLRKGPGGPATALGRLSGFICGRGTWMLGYLVIRLCLGLMAASVALTVGLLSCGVAFLPYFGAVLLLPLHSVWRLYPLFFLREIGFDAWSVDAGPRVEERGACAKPPRLSGVPPRLSGVG